MKTFCSTIFFILGLVHPIYTQSTTWNVMAIQPYTENKAYWQYENIPVLLIGGTDNDNIFQTQHFHSHLDSLSTVGGNYIRCTMSDRDNGDLRAFEKQNDGKYDLRKWNSIYWDQFEDLLQTAQSLGIIVQIELWDRFDHSRKEWLTDPWNPGNNVNYTYDETRLESSYPNHPGANEQPFFYTVPALENNQVLLSYQRSFVDKLLSISLNYNNILYCIDNETKGAPEWGRYWAHYLHQKAGDKKIYITEMWDAWNVTAGLHKETINHPEIYDFIDLSQNSQTTGHANWVNPQTVINNLGSFSRPVNSVKIYGSRWNPTYVEQGKDADHAVQTFFKNILGGYASSRFHRPPTGLGLSERSTAAILTIREIEKKVKFWDLNPRLDLLSDLQPGEAYLAADAGQSYVIYFPSSGEVGLDLTNVGSSLTGAWISTRGSSWKKEESLSLSEGIRIKPPDDTGWFFVIFDKD